MKYHRTYPLTLAGIQHRIEGHTLTLAQPWKQQSVLQASHIAEIDGVKPKPGDLIPGWVGRILGIFTEHGVSQ